MPNLDPKIEALLLKLRKGAYASITPKQRLAILTMFGWKIEKIIGVAETSYNMNVTEAPEETKRQWDNLKKQGVPNNPKKGEKYITRVGDIGPAGFVKKYTTFTYQTAIGVDGFDVTSPSGKTFRLLPDGNTFETHNKIQFHLYKFFPWLYNETEFKQQVLDALGMGEHIPAALRSRDSTGTCPVCFHNVKIRQNRMVLHGYTRPGYGWIEGKCFGVGYLPFELSPEGSKDFITKALEPHLTGLEKYLQDLKSGKATKFTRTRGTWNKTTEEITPEHPRWKQHLESAIHSTEYDISTTKSQIEQYKNEIAHWVLRELPKEGDNPFKRWTDPVVKKVATRYLTRFK